MSLPVLGRDEISALQITSAEINDAVASALAAIGDAETQCPRKLIVNGPHSVSYAMLARLGVQGLVGFKTSYTHWSDDNRAAGKSYATSLLLCDEATGQPVVWMDGGRIGALRTSAVTALLAQHTCRIKSRAALIIGTGTQGRGTIEALAATLPSLEEIFVAGSHPDGLRSCLETARSAGFVAHAAKPDDVHAVAGRCQLVVGAAGPHSSVRVRHDHLAPGTTTIIVGSGIGASCVAEADLLVATSAEQMQVTGTDLVAPDGSLREADLELPQALRENIAVRTDPEQIICCYNSGLVVTDIALGALVARRALADAAANQEVDLW